MREIPDFPGNIELFDSDERISYSKLDKKYIAVHDDGSEFEFDPETRTWIPFDEEEEDHQEAGAQADEDARGLKRKFDAEGSPEKPRAPKKQKAPPPPKQNTAVYVTGIPPDATTEEIQELFSKKGGVIAEDESGNPRIKMYRDDEGVFKGDALVVFFKPESVNMAIMLLDESDFRFSDSGRPSGKIRVQAAEMSYKKTQPAAEGEVPQISDKERQKRRKKREKLDAKLADWDDDPPAMMPVNKKWDKTVILKHMFTIEELEEDGAALFDIKADIREGCEKMGAIVSLELYDKDPEGMVAVKFEERDAAQACVDLLNGRSFGGQVVEAVIATGPLPKVKH